MLEKTYFEYSIAGALEFLEQFDIYEIDKESTNRLINFLYTPDSRMQSFIDDLEYKIALSNMNKKDRPDDLSQEIGDRLEQIAFLAFNSLRGLSNITSFQSSGPQYDLIVTGCSDLWEKLCKLLHMDFSARDMLIEAKATKSSVGDPQFARMCSLLNTNLKNTAGLGIFFTINGASGFPDSNNRKMQSLKNAKLRQVLFKFATNKSVIVFNINDIYTLNQKGSLVHLLIDKVKDIEYNYCSYRDPQYICDPPVSTPLPYHLQSLIKG